MFDCMFCFPKAKLCCVCSVALMYLQWDCCLMVSGSDRLIVGKNVWIHCTLQDKHSVLDWEKKATSLCLILLG